MIVSLVRREGIYLAADSRRTGHVTRDDAFKLITVGPQTIGALRGSASLEDDETGEVLLAGTHLENMLDGPLQSTKVAATATEREWLLAARSTRPQILMAFQPFTNHLADDWNKAGLLAKVKAAPDEDPFMIGLTLAQEEADGWMLVIDLRWVATVSSDQSRVEIALHGGQPIQLGHFKDIRYRCLPGPGCDAAVPNHPQESDDPVEWIDQVFALTTKHPQCSEHIGGPIDIALAQKGSVQFLRLKTRGPTGSGSSPPRA